MEALDEVIVERAELCRCRPLEGLRVPLLVKQAAIEDGTPMEAEVAEEVRGMKGGRAGGPLGMRTEYLKVWLREETRKQEPVSRMWELLVRLVHRTFGDGNPPEELAWATMVLTLKGKGDFWDIGIVEVARKVCKVVVNFQLKRGLSLHDNLHGFRVGHGTGKATLEANMDQKLSGLAHEPLFQVFLDTSKDYDSPYKGRCLVVLQECMGWGRN